MQTLRQKAIEIITEGAHRTPTFDTLNEFQQKELTAAAINDLGKNAHETLDDVVISEGFIKKIIEALQEDNIADQKVLLKEIGEMLLQGAIEGCKKTIDDALDEAISNLALRRHFYDDAYEARLVIALDNADRARDINEQNKFYRENLWLSQI